MANSKDRRILRRALREAGLSKAPNTTAPPAPPASIPFGRKIPPTVYAVLVSLGLLITLLEGYPWLPLQEGGGTINPLNPYKTLFLLVNQGYAPITDIDVQCIPQFKTTDYVSFPGEITVQHPVAGTYWHNGQATLPCVGSVNYPDEPHPPGGILLRPNSLITEASMQVKVIYSFLGLRFKQLRRSQTFKLRAIRVADGSFRWLISN